MDAPLFKIEELRPVSVPADSNSHLNLSYAAYLITPGASLFSHFLLDLLPRVKVLVDHGIELSALDGLFINKITPFFKYAFER